MRTGTDEDFGLRVEISARDEKPHRTFYGDNTVMALFIHDMLESNRTVKDLVLRMLKLDDEQKAIVLEHIIDEGVWSEIVKQVKGQDVKS